MVDVDQLPIPDWGLRCPQCGAPLAGMTEHRCQACGRRFSIRQVLGQHRPVPDLGLTCTECGYLLTGLTGSKCPECGTEFSIREMLEEISQLESVLVPNIPDPLDHHIKRREPDFTGEERPLPDFGLHCRQCEGLLVGAPADTCPFCGLPFDLSAIIPRGDWVDISSFVPKAIQALAKTVLYQDEVPFVLDNAGLVQVYGGSIAFIPVRLRIPREFFFDALYVLTAAAAESSNSVASDWICPSCGEHVPAGFAICWNCSTPYPGCIQEDT